MKVIFVLAPVGFSLFSCLISLSIKPVLCDIPSGGGLQHCLPPDACEQECGPIGVEPQKETYENSINKDGLCYSFKVALQYLCKHLPGFEPLSFYSEELLHKSETTLALLCSSVAFIMYQIIELPNLLTTTMTSLSNYIPGNLAVLLPPFLYGFSVIIFSWMLIYHDSKVPGVYPPSPLSPKKLREKSGHTFHLGYTVGLVNGLVVFALSLWSQLRC